MGKNFLLKCKEILKFHTKILNLEMPEVEILEPCAMPSPTTQSAVNQKGDIAINKDFLENFLKYPLQLQMVLAHEIRHSWQVSNGKGFIQNYSSRHDNLTDYNSQEAEIDAWAYSFAFLKVYFGVQPEINVLSKEVVQEIKTQANKLLCLFTNK